MSWKDRKNWQTTSEPAKVVKPAKPAKPAAESRPHGAARAERAKPAKRDMPATRAKPREASRRGPKPERPPEKAKPVEFRPVLYKGQRAAMKTRARELELRSPKRYIIALHRLEVEGKIEVTAGPLAPRTEAPIRFRIEMAPEWCKAITVRAERKGFQGLGSYVVAVHEADVKAAGALDEHIRAMGASLGEC